MSSNSGLLVRVYPNTKQKSLLKKACLYRFHYYKALAMWWNTTYNICCKLYKDFCVKELDEDKRKEYSKTLPWPPKKVTKEGLNDTCLKISYNDVPKFMKFACTKHFTEIVKKGKDKGLHKDYGDVFRLNAVYLPTVYGNRIVDSSVSAWCKDNFAQSVTKTFKDKKNSCIRYPKFNDANTFKISIKGLQVKKNNKGQVNKIYIPFLSGEYRKKLGTEIEWFNCSLSDSQLEKVSNASAMIITFNSADQWFSAVSVYKEQEDKQDNTGLECGIDLGIKSNAVVAFSLIGEKDSSKDTYIKYDLPIEKIKVLEAKIEHLQKIQMRRIKTWLRLNKDDVAKGLKLNTDKKDKSHNAVFVYRKRYQSESFKRTEKRIAQINVKIANIRKNFSEQFSREIANKCDTVGLEDLHVKGMMKNHRLARSITRIGFYKLRTALERKMTVSRIFILNKWAPSSQVCSSCGYKNKKVKNLNVREWVCPICGKYHDRDENAASNIRPSNQEKTNSYCKQNN